MAEEKEPVELKFDKIGASVAAVLLFLMVVASALKRGKLFGLEQKNAEHMFHTIVLTGKVGLVGMFLLLSFINGHKAYVEKNPRGFMAGSLIIAITSALGGLLIAWNRQRPDMFFNTLFIGALFFFVFAVSREFSGYFAFMSGQHLEGTEQKQRNIMAPIIGLMMGAAIIYMIYLAFVARVAPPGDMLLPGGFITEMFLFTVICGIGEVIVAKQHGEAVGPAVASSVVLFGGAHVLLQYGGFYKELFGKPPIDWNMFNAAN